MPRLRVRAWLGFTLLALLAFGVTTLVGAAAGGLDIVETCELAHHRFDRDYLDQHWQDYSQFFPMSQKCNADYDMVPGWVNPALVIFAVAAVTCLVGAAAATTRLIRNSR